MNKPIRHVRAGDLPPTDIPRHVDDYLRQTTPVLHRVDASELPGGIYFSEPPEHISTPETRKERASFWRRAVLLIAATAVWAISAIYVVFFN